MMAPIPILVASCDGYADLWQPFFTLFFRHWPDCPHPIHLGTNFETYDDPRVRTIRVGADRGWAGSVSTMLEELNARHVILLLEDFFIERDVDAATVRSLAELAQQRADVASIRLSPLPAPSMICGEPFAAMPELLRVVPPGTPYRVSAQPAIWRVDALRRFLQPGFTAWEFEMVGSQMADLSDELFLGPVRPSVVYQHSLVRGRWRAEGLRICREHGIEIDPAMRGVIHEQERAPANVIAATKMAAMRMLRRVAGARAARLVRRLLIARHIRRAARRTLRR